MKGEPILRAALAAHGKTLRFYRHPFLFTGPTPEIKKGMQDVLDRQGYRVAPVTLDNADYQFAALYTRPEYRERVRRRMCPTWSRSSRSSKRARSRSSAGSSRSAAAARQPAQRRPDARPPRDVPPPRLHVRVARSALAELAFRLALRRMSVRASRSSDNCDVATSQSANSSNMHIATHCTLPHTSEVLSPQNATVASVREDGASRALWPADS